MSKLDELRRTAGANVKDSTGADRGDRPGPGEPAGPPARWRGVSRPRDAALIPLGMIERDPDQPREEFDPEALERLAESLKARGQLQPCRVRWDEGRGAYVILVGERRWRAARLAGLESLSCIVHEAELPAEERLMIQLVENALREDLRPIEQARSYRRLMEAQGWSATRLAKELAIAQPTVTRALNLLDLPAAVQESVDQGRLSPSAAYEASKLERPEDQEAVARAAQEQGLTRDEVAELVQAVKARRPPKAKAERPGPIEFDLGDGITVMIRYKRPSDAGPVQVLRKALRLAQERQGRGEAAA